MAINIYGKLKEVVEMADFLAGQGSVAGLEELHARVPWNTYSLEYPKMTEEVRKYVRDKLNSEKEGSEATERVDLVKPSSDIPGRSEDRSKTQPVHRGKRSGRVGKRPSAKPEG